MASQTHTPVCVHPLTMTRFVPTEAPSIGLVATILHWWRPAVAVAFFFCLLMAASKLLVVVSPRAPRLPGLLCGALVRLPKLVWRAVTCKCCRRREPDDEDGIDDWERWTTKQHDE